MQITCRWKERYDNRERINNKKGGKAVGGNEREKQRGGRMGKGEKGEKERKNRDDKKK